MLLVVNKTPTVFDVAEVKERVERAYGCEVAAVLPHAEELMVLSSVGVFVTRYPAHPVTALYKQVASSFLGYRPDGHGAGRRSIHASPPFGAD
jgi:hypothetical protein